MAEQEVARASTTEGLPVAPSLGPTLQSAHIPKGESLVNNRVFFISGLAMGIAAAAAVIAQGLVRLIGLITNLSFYGRLSTDFVSPADNHLGLCVVLIPILGGLVVGFMARYGSHAIRGHGIPEAMEQVLVNQSRIPPRLTFLKPLSAAISIGTGGPFGAEGPIIATGGALGSLFGQLLKTTADERKILLSAGAAAGMAATFGSPVSAVLLAIELLLFEFRSRSLIPVALASVTAAGLRIAFVGPHPIFAMPDVPSPSGTALASYLILGGVVGVASVFITRIVYAIEDGFARLPLHWMWWPALGGIVVGLVGYWAPRTMGVGYDNIEHILSGSLPNQTLVLLCALKFVSWSVALGSGTSGGTLAPLFTIGGALGAIFGGGIVFVLPHVEIDPRVAALVGMAAMFAGASRALLASVVFAFETTLQPFGLLPLLGGCTAAYLVSCSLMRHTIMTEKIVRRGIRVPAEYSADILAQALVRDYASRNVVTFREEDTIEAVRRWINSGTPGSTHTGFPVVDHQTHILGIITRRDLYRLDVLPTQRLREVIHKPPILIYEDNSLREAADLMIKEDIGRLPVVTRVEPRKAIGILTRSDLLSAYRRCLDEASERQRGIHLRFNRQKRRKFAPSVAAE